MTNASVLDWGLLVDPDEEVAGSACPIDWLFGAEAAALGVVAKEVLADNQRVAVALQVGYLFPFETMVVNQVTGSIFSSSYRMESSPSSSRSPRRPSPPLWVPSSTSSRSFGWEM